MVWSAPKCSLRAASCCRVDVVKGGAGLRRVCLRSMDPTENSAAVIAATAASASALEPSPILPSFLPLRWVRPALNEDPSARPNSVVTVQYSWGLKASISDSRSQIRRRATDCTRPADRLPGNLRHSTGESVKPTR